MCALQSHLRQRRMLRQSAVRRAWPSAHGGLAPCNPTLSGSGVWSPHMGSELSEPRLREFDTGLGDALSTASKMANLRQVAIPRPPR